MISTKEKHLNVSQNEVLKSKSKEENVSEIKPRNGETHAKRTLPSISKYNSPYIISCSKSAQANNSPVRVNSNMVKQKVYSATNLRMKHLENQLAENQVFMNELLTENKLLRRLQKRQDKALSRYEGTNAELPKLLDSHSEEIRILKEKLKQLKQNYADCEKKLKSKDNELSKLKEKHLHLLHLVKENGLDEREKLQKEVEDLTFTINEQNRKIQDLNRKIMLEEKNQKYYRQQETKKNRILVCELEDARKQIQRLEDAVAKKNRKLFEPQSLKDREAFTSSAKPALTFNRKGKFTIGNSLESGEKHCPLDLRKILEQLSNKDKREGKKPFSQYKPQPKEEDVIYDQTMSDITDNMEQELMFSNSDEEEEEKITVPPFQPISDVTKLSELQINNEIFETSHHSTSPSEDGISKTVILSRNASNLPTPTIDKEKLLETLRKNNISLNFEDFHKSLNNPLDHKIIEDEEIKPIHNNGDSNLIISEEYISEHISIKEENEKNCEIRSSNDETELEEEDNDIDIDGEEGNEELSSTMNAFNKAKLLEALKEIDEMNENKSNGFIKSSSEYSKLLDNNETHFINNGHMDNQGIISNHETFQLNLEKIIQKKNNLSDSGKNLLETL